MRRSHFLLRTSRKGPGSWSEPILLGSRRGIRGDTTAAAAAPVSNSSGVPASVRKGVCRSSDKASNSKDGAGTTVSSPMSSSGLPPSFTSSSTFYDGGDNAHQHGGGGGGGRGDASHPSHYNWKADPAWSRPPSHIDFPITSLRGAERGSTPQNAKRVGTTAPPIHDGSQAGGTGDESNASEGQTNWLGGKRGGATPDTLEHATMQHAFGAGDFSMVDRQKLTFTRFTRLLVDATFKPRDADSRAFGGDGATKLAEQREELKTMDQRIVPFQHDDIMNDFLKNIDRLHTPSGALCQREVLKGRLVGLLFFTESARSTAFMRHLQSFHQQHSPDFVVVAVSLAGKEAMDLTRSFGFFHCTHRDGATWVTRDCGLMMRPFVPMPRLIVVDGTTGLAVTRSGVTAVMGNAEACFQEWRRGDVGYRYRDVLKSIYL